MNRRDVIRILAATPVLGVARRSLAQQPIENRRAIVIGVDKPGDLAPLRAAQSGAKSMANWLTEERYSNVKLLVDDAGPVKASLVFDAVEEAIKSNPSQLLIYFAGHGIFNFGTELWLLSGSPDNPNEAVSLAESLQLAKGTSIRNIAIVSDCCRTIPNNLRAARIRGSLIFPSTEPLAPTGCDVDLFLATSIAAPSYEVASKGAEAYTGIYTRTFMDAFINPPAEMMSEVAGEYVVSNKALKKYLAEEVPKRAETASIKITQHPETLLYSPDGTFIARARRQAVLEQPISRSIEAPVARGPASLPLPPIATSRTERAVLPQTRTRTIRSGSGPTAVLPDAAIRNASRIDPSLIKTRMATVTDVANSQLEALNFKSDASDERFTKEQLKAAANESGFDAARSKILNARQLMRQFSGSCGFTLVGQRVSAATARSGVKIRIQNPSSASSMTSQVEIDVSEIPGRAASVALRFADGTGTVLPVIDGYIGNIVVDEGCVSSVSFLHTNDVSDQRLAEYHALVATSARFGTFRIDGPRATRELNARKLADKVRTGKSSDPTLGIYAAYAYSEAGLNRDVESVRGFMRSDLRGAELFDVALLAGALSGTPGDSPNRPLPHMPMLSQGWALLRVKRVQLHPAIADAQDYVKQGLWTTLASPGMDLIEKALKNGALV